MSEDAARRVQEAALVARPALGCRTMSRTDLIVDEQGVVWVLETDTIPGMTPASLLRAGVSTTGRSSIRATADCGPSAWSS